LVLRPNPSMPNTSSKPDSKLKWLVIAGCTSIGAAVWLWPSPEQALIARLIEIESSMNQSPAAFAEVAPTHLTDPFLLRVQAHFEEELTPSEAAERWQRFYQFYGPVVVELEQLEASLEPLEVKGKVLVSSQPRDLHARSHAFTAKLVRVGEDRFRVESLTLYRAPAHLPEARP